MHPHSHEKNEDEFGYITDEEEDDDSEEDDDDESLSGERDYDHAHIKTLHVPRRVKHAEHPRDSHVMGKVAGEEDEESEDEQSGEGDLNSIQYDHSDLQTIGQENESEDYEGSLNSEDEEDVVNLSGAERVSVGDEDKIPEDNDEYTVLQAENARRKNDHSDLQTIGQESESEDYEGSLNSEDEEDVVNLSGAERVSVRDEDKIPEDNDEHRVLQAENARKKSAGPVKREILEDNKEEAKDGQRKNATNKRKIPKKNVLRKKQQKSPSSKTNGPAVNNQISSSSQKLNVHAEIDLSNEKNHLASKGATSKQTKSAISVLKARKNPKMKQVESEKGTESDLNNVEDFYLDESDEPKDRMFAVEMQDAKNDKDNDENTNPGHQKINKRAQTEDDKVEGGHEFRRGNSRHLLQIMNTTDPMDALPGQWHIWYNLILEKFSEGNKQY